MKQSVRVLAIGYFLSLSTALFANPTIEDAWIRLMPPNVQTTAAYALLSSEQADVLLGAEADFVSKVEIHETAMKDGMMSMRPVDSVNIEAGETAKLEPQGKHIMLIGLQRALSEGEQVTIRLNFQEIGVLEVPFIVRKP